MNEYFSHHTLTLAILSSVATWLFNNVITVMITSLPAPTRDSTPGYVYWFKVANTIIGNIQRAKSTAIESSPNWAAASQAHVDKMNGKATGNIGDH